MIGTLVNAVAVLAGGALGILFRRRIPVRLRDGIMQALGLATLVIGAQMAFETHHVVVLIVSLVAGAALGEAARIEDGLQRLGEWAEGRLGAAGEGGAFARAFVMSSLLFCVGPLTILGSIQGGLGQPPLLLYTKSMLDGASSVAIGAALGAGVFLSALTVLVYQGLLTMLASAVQALLTPDMTREFTATGGVLVIGIALNLLRVQSIRVGNLLPALLVSPVLMGLSTAFAGFARMLLPMR